MEKVLDFSPHIGYNRKAVRIRRGILMVRSHIGNVVCRKALCVRVASSPPRRKKSALRTFLKEAFPLERLLFRKFDTFASTGITPPLHYQPFSGEDKGFFHAINSFSFSVFLWDRRTHFPFFSFFLQSRTVCNIIRDTRKRWKGEAGKCPEK